MLLMNDRKSIYFNIAFFAVLIVGYLLFSFYSSPPAPPPQLSFESAGLNRPLVPLRQGGQPRSVKDYRGAPILLHFWASWCEPCRRDEKPLQELFASGSERGVQFVTVASEDKLEAIRSAGKLDAYPGDNYFDPSGELALAFSVKSYPQTLLIDREGRVLFRADSPLTDEDLRGLRSSFAETAPVLPAFEFPEAGGKKLSSAELKEKVWLANFIFTGCGNICPMISEKLRVLQEEFGKDSRFQIVSFSVDPKNDTPARLLAFGKRHGADPKVWSFLRPEDKALHQLMARGFRLGTLEDPLYHTAKIVLVDRGNVITEYFDGDSLDVIPKLEAKVRALLAAP